MNIKKISYVGIVGLSMLAGAITSCNETKYENNAKAKAIKYLNGDELLKAERFARQQYNSDQYDGEEIAYWDSLLIEAKAKQAYLEGQQLIRDSVNGIHYKKVKYKAPLDTVMTSNIIEGSKNEYAKYVSAEEFLKARNNVPHESGVNFANNLVGSTHYWNLITLAGRQNEAYQKGMADARTELKANTHLNSK